MSRETLFGDLPEGARLGGNGRASATSRADRDQLELAR